MITLRPFRPDDLDALYDVQMATAADPYEDRRLLGHIYSAPYARLEPRLAFVAETPDGVGGYVLGTLDTRVFEDRLEAEWWPALRRRYPDPSGDRPAWTPDQRRAHMIHHPHIAPDEVVAAFPAHLHMKISPALQSRGIGGSLLDLWLGHAEASGARSAHVGVNAANVRGVAFWERHGFQRLAAPGPTVWMGRRLPTP